MEMEVGMDMDMWMDVNGLLSLQNLHTNACHAVVIPLLD